METNNRIHAIFKKDGFHITYNIPYKESRNIMEWLDKTGLFREITSDKDLK